MFRCGGAMCRVSTRNATFGVNKFFRKFQSTLAGSDTTKESFEFLDSFTDYEKVMLPDQSPQSSDRFSLKKMRKLLWRLGDPQNSAQAVHVAGSKGKGSVCKILGSIFSNSEFRVGVYTSPHVNELTERISIGRLGTDCELQNISKEDFAKTIARYRGEIDKMILEGESAPTYFELLTGLALKHFENEGIKNFIIEVGLGGECDATNIFETENLALAILNPIGIEHANVLGGTLESIIKAKTGILKEGCKVLICKQQHPTISEILIKIANSKNCHILKTQDMVKIESHGYETSETLMYENLKITLLPELTGFANGTVLRDVSTRLFGAHQHENIKVAVIAAYELKRQGWTLRDKAIRRALRNICLPGRINVFRKDKESNWYVIDGAHTRDSAMALYSTLRSIFSTQPVILVISMLQDKDYEGMLKPLIAMKPKCVIFTSVNINGTTSRSLPPGTLVAHWEKCEMVARKEMVFRCRKIIQNNMHTALEKAVQELVMFRIGEASDDEKGVICVTGSFYTVREALKILQN